MGDLDGGSTRRANNWTATVTIAVHDNRHNPVTGVLVRGIWNGVSANWSECTTGQNGDCTVRRPDLPNSIGQVSFAPTTMTRSGYVFQPAGNHDPDGSSNGFSIVVKR